jgi:hypothetical protein
MVVVPRIDAHYSGVGITDSFTLLELENTDECWATLAVTHLL